MLPLLSRYSGSGSSSVCVFVWKFFLRDCCNCRYCFERRECSNHSVLIIPVIPLLDCMHRQRFNTYVSEYNEVFCLYSAYVFKESGYSEEPSTSPLCGNEIN